MIERSFIFFILLTLLPDVYIDYRYFRQRLSVWQRLLWLVPSALILVLLCHMAGQPDFIPRNYTVMEVFMLVLGLIIVPKTVFCICSALGWGHNAYHHTTQRWGERIGLAAAAAVMVLFLYGFTLGTQQVRVRHITVSSHDLPASMDGYRIAHISDLHVGTYQGWRRATLKTIVDSVNGQHPDLICFTGDLQNTRPDEIANVKELISSRAFAAPVVSILGNHDYGQYAGGRYKEKSEVARRVVSTEKDTLGWRLLLNENFRPCASRSPLFYIAGTENDGKKPADRDSHSPRKANYRKTVSGIPRGAYVLMLQHDPSAWQRSIIDSTTAQLTLSGHTHGGQMSIFGLRPTMLGNSEDYGLYERDGRLLYVSCGAGGVVPFRLAMPSEITIITLKHQ